MNPVLGILLMLNNYVHDVATGLLLIAALWLAWSASDLGDSPSRALVSYFKRTYRRCVRFSLGSIAVIVLTGVVRAVNFMQFEWMPALGRGLTQVLILKHVLIFSMLVAGGYAWWSLRRRLTNLGGWDEA